MNHEHRTTITSLKNCQLEWRHFRQFDAQYLWAFYCFFFRYEILWPTPFLLSPLGTGRIIGLNFLTFWWRCSKKIKNLPSKVSKYFKRYSVKHRPWYITKQTAACSKLWDVKCNQNYYFFTLGSVRVLKEFVRDLADSQIPNVAPVVLPDMYRIFMEKENYSVRTRSRAIEIFNTLASLICTMAETDKTIFKAILGK